MSTSFKVRFQCPDCHARLSAKDKAAGHRLECPNCTSAITVPTTTALVPLKPQIVVPEVIDDYEPARRLARRGRRRKSSVPVEMRLPGQLGGMRVEVDRRTSNAMATTFLGGLLVAVGAVLFAMFGGKSKSA
jgi:hypothetical protein